MPITETHEIHHRRLGRNLGVALCLAGFVGLSFFLTISKLRNGGTIEGFDYVPQPEFTVGEGTE
tara:strand:- start:335 stop:526 length:192 start_codon:yes stop_codon:yes gene_type:complete